jgi:hypothetical protein
VSCGDGGFVRRDVLCIDTSGVPVDEVKCGNDAKPELQVPECDAHNRARQSVGSHVRSRRATGNATSNLPSHPALHVA